MVKPILIYLGTSKVKEIRKGGSVTFQWPAPPKKPVLKKFKNPTKASTKKVAYNKTTKDKVGSKPSAWKAGDNRSHFGTVIPATATRTIDGVSRVCDVRYRTYGATTYTRTAALKKDKKMLKTTYNNSTHPMYYELQYKEKPVVDKAYSEYVDGVEYIFFHTFYLDDGGNEVETTAHLPHPTKCEPSYSDCRRNFDTSKANNQDGRDNHGTYVLSNVRANIMTLELMWEGLSEDAGREVLDTLNPSKDSKGQYPYLIAQLYDPATGNIVNKTFFASSDRKVVPYPNGMYKEISVTLTEV